MVALLVCTYLEQSEGRLASFNVLSYCVAWCYSGMSHNETRVSMRHSWKPALRSIYL